MAQVTALHTRPGDRVAVELDGEPWRVLPAVVVARARVSEGRKLDREALRALRRELRRHEALVCATRALHHRDLSRRGLEERLGRAGAAPAALTDALDTLERVGLVDDARLAASRALALAERGHGDAAIRADLERRGVGPGIVEAALTALEDEVERACRLVRARGASAKTAAYLARRGFGEEAVDAAVGPPIANEPYGE